MTRGLLFSGENRRKDLTRLIRAFDDVAAAAEASNPRDLLKQATHRIVLIHAERGLGKTRLAMELYRHLALQRDPEGYWPEIEGRDGGHAVAMPRAADCDFSSSPSFLWWGMALDPPPTTGNTVFKTLDELLVHLAAVQLARRRDRSRRDAVSELADLALELGMEFGDTLLEELPLIGTVKRVGTSAWKIGSIVARHNQSKGAPVEHADEQMKLVVDSVLSDLDAMFSPRSSQFARRPLVVFVDDAQFADGDPAMAAFLERIIAQSARNSWPLLLVMTHWSRQLRQWQDRDGVWQSRSRVAQVLHHARRQRESDLGTFAGEGGASLLEENYIEIDLGEPVSDLTPALLDRFPGIAAETVAEIIEKCGNNPRKLEQVVLVMEDHPVWFHDFDETGDLTQEGREAILAESRLEIDSIVAHRFDDTPPVVRKALALASTIGPTFVVELVDRIARAKLSGGIRPGLEDGETRYRFVRDIVDRSRNDVGAFSERLFLDAAEGYRRSGKAHKNLAPWPADQEIFALVDQLLTEFVQDPAAINSFAADDLAHLLNVAVSRWTQDGHPLTGLALARLFRLENKRGNIEGANEAALRFIAGFAETWSLDDIPGDLAEQLAVRLWRLSDIDGAVALWQALLPRYEATAARNPDNTHWQHKLFRSHNTVAFLEHLRGNGDASRSAYEVSLIIFERLAAGRSDRDQELRDHQQVLGEAQPRVRLAAGMTSWQVIDWLRRLDVLVGDVPEVPAEGSLAPGVYDIAPGMERSALVAEMQQRQAAILAEAWQSRAAELPLGSPEEALILASIVEKEAKVSEQRPLIASVFINRLRRGIRLQSDQTVIFALTEGRGPFDRPLRRRDLLVDHPYNTYLAPALPPGPVANPGRASIEAALNLEQTQHYHFVADGAGGRAFATSLEQHDFNVKVWRGWTKWAGEQRKQ